MPVKSSAQLTLRDRLSRLTFDKACKWLGQDGTKLMRKAVRPEFEPGDVQLDKNELRATFRPANGAPIYVAMKTANSGQDRVAMACSEEKGAAGYFAAVLHFVLEEKVWLGLAEPPPEEGPAPFETLDATALERRALEEREQRAREEKMKVTRAAGEAEGPWGDYLVRSFQSGKTYRVALRGWERGESFCACGDFRKNTLGTCKHVLRVSAWVRKRTPPAELRRPFTPAQIAVHVRYDGEARLAVELPPRLPAALVMSWRGRAVRTPAEAAELVSWIGEIEAKDGSVLIYPDAEELLEQMLHRGRLGRLVEKIRRAPAAHPLRSSLLRAELLPYQLDGIAFAAGAGRAVLADEMGLGKTIQGVGVAELLAQQAEMRRVLIICPASLKSQWAAEIARFSGRSVQLVAGPSADRAAQYDSEAFFTICNYEQVLRDFLPIERARWDLIILDEGQRIKNWEAQTSRVVKSLRSRFALVLTGTPIENRLDDLYSIIEFIDERRLGPAFRFFHRHRNAEESGKVLGYKNLADLREQLAPVLLRRTRASVALDLPPRTTQVVRIAPTDEQLALHNGHMNIVATIVKKKFITEMDLLRLRRALMAARMSANSTFLVEKTEPSYSTKLEQLRELLGGLIAEPERKILLFSEWTTMLDLIEPILRELRAPFLRLDGSVPQAKRKQLVAEFQRDPKCRVFLTTNAGSTGLNLQAADTVINVELPWNPALLEQRIARAHRLGQKRKVQVYLLVTERTIEESLLATLGAKHELAAAVLDPDSQLSEVQLVSGTEELKRRLEVLLGSPCEAPVDVSADARAQAEATALVERRTRVSAAGGQLLSAAFQFLGELLPATAEPDPKLAATLSASLAECVEPQADGSAKLSFTLPDGGAVAALGQALARLLSATGAAK